MARSPNLLLRFGMDGLLLDSERPVRDAWFLAAHETGFALSGVDSDACLVFEDSESVSRNREKCATLPMQVRLTRGHDGQSSAASTRAMAG
jgi:beta-phosphoglucomutase-like phosphatase (HAD superfamily)